ncbi:SCO family protein [Streptomyces sp. XM4193]|uniref:SCO family protein n=1 Tax=Streptomyces sp. XM4193 TaxID=2929782 RepID=UPI001FFB6DE4|nr:SCO family protein [Streptomyces sp. XM4193]MCK1794707.1 SCO family protein [Streptomyces sp. XM4193]
MHRTTAAPPRGRRPRRGVYAAALAAALALGLTACGSDSGSGKDSGDKGDAIVEGSQDSGTKKATVLDRPFEKPDLVLTDTEGEEYDFIEETKGRPTLIYFGYTNCPDVCPLTMSNIAVARNELPKKDQEKLRVVFVTTDPDRDTPEELGKWLKSAAPGSVGLTGDFDTIQAGARTLGISIEPSTKDKKGQIVSNHGSQVLFFSPKDDKARVLYTDKVTQETYTEDLPKLVEGETP